MTNVTLDNAIKHTDEEICEAIKGKVFSLGDLQNPQCQFPLKRIDNIKQLIDKEEEDAWDKVKDSDDVNSIDDFLKSYPNSKHADEADGIKKNIQEKKDADEAWKNVDKKSRNDLKTYQKEFPGFHSKDIAEAINSMKLGTGYEALKLEIDKTILTTVGTSAIKEEAMISKIDELHKSKRISDEDVLRFVTEDPNRFHVAAISELIQRGYFDEEDLLDKGIDSKFIPYIGNSNPPTQMLASAGPIKGINKESTEIYFWGIPSSGKTCALGAILSVAYRGSVAKTMDMDNKCQGYKYMNDLSTMFDEKGKVFVLPDRTIFNETYEMEFDLVDNKQKRHPITLIDLSGELMMSMYKKDTDPNFLSNGGDLLRSLDTLTSLLINNCSKNRKFHFFVLEYGAENRTYQGIKQDKCLSAALKYIQCTGIFAKDTDAIYVLVTKTDKIKNKDKENAVKCYIQKNCRSFYNGLKLISADCNINGGNKSNGGRVGVFAFSLGTVAFRDYCIFDDTAAVCVVKELLTRTGVINNNRLAK